MKLNNNNSNNSLFYKHLKFILKIKPNFVIAIDVVPKIFRINAVI